uniref:Ubiquinol-cytochrome c chaperone domain-containing protein n=1 Tax=Leersia perrieri TaxID=77586 RepID=A0A0D9WYY9_9ORYZ
MSRWRAAAARISAATESRLLSRAFSKAGAPAPQPPCRAFSKASAAAAASRGPTAAAAAATSSAAGARPEVRLNSMFLSKPCSLALPPDSPLRVEDPKFTGIKHFLLTLLLFYSKQSKSIRGANVIFHRITSQVDKSDIYDVFQLEKTFKTTFALLVLHMWLVLRRLKEEGKDGVKFGQYIYEVYNHDVELRVSKAGVNLLLTKWMKELEKIFYGNIVKYDAAISPEARQDDLALARYTRREATCLSLTDKEAMFSGNFKFTTLLPNSPSPAKPVR